MDKSRYHRLKCAILKDVVQSSANIVKSNTSLPSHENNIVNECLVSDILDLNDAVCANNAYQFDKKVVEEIESNITNVNRSIVTAQSVRESVSRYNKAIKVLQKHKVDKLADKLNKIQDNHHDIDMPDTLRRVVEPMGDDVNVFSEESAKEIENIITTSLSHVDELTGGQECDLMSYISQGQYRGSGGDNGQTKVTISEPSRSNAHAGYAYSKYINNDEMIAQRDYIALKKTPNPPITID